MVWNALLSGHFVLVAKGGWYALLFKRCLKQMQDSYRNHFSGALKWYKSEVKNCFTRFDSFRNQDISGPWSSNRLRQKLGSHRPRRRLQGCLKIIVWGTTPLKPSMNNYTLFWAAQRMGLLKHLRQLKVVLSKLQGHQKRVGLEMTQVVLV